MVVAGQCLSSQARDLSPKCRPEPIHRHPTLGGTGDNQSAEIQSMSLGGTAAEFWGCSLSQEPLSMLPPSRGTAGSRGMWMEPGAWAAWPACSASSPSCWGPSSSCSTSRSAFEVTPPSRFPCSSSDLSFFPLSVGLRGQFMGHSCP